MDFLGESTRDRRKAVVKILKWQCAWGVCEKARKPVWLELRRRKVLEEETGEITRDIFIIRHYRLLKGL